MQKLGLFTEQWSPKVVAEMNDYQFKVVRLQGDFIWHSHKDTDEAFIVLEGEMRIDFHGKNIILQLREPSQLKIVQYLTVLPVQRELGQG